MWRSEAKFRSSQGIADLYIRQGTERKKETNPRLGVMAGTEALAGSRTGTEAGL